MSSSLKMNPSEPMRKVVGESSAGSSRESRDECTCSWGSIWGDKVCERLLILVKVEFCLGVNKSVSKGKPVAYVFEEDRRPFSNPFGGGYE